MVKRGHIAFHDRRQGHDARVVDHHVDPAVSIEGLPEEALHIRHIRDIRLNGDGLPTGGLDFGHDFLGPRGAARAVHHDGEAVACQSSRDHTSDTA